MPMADHVCIQGKVYQGFNIHCFSMDITMAEFDWSTQGVGLKISCNIGRNEARERELGIMI
jgi:hypothetical protein